MFVLYNYYICFLCNEQKYCKHEISAFNIGISLIDTCAKVMPFDSTGSDTPFFVVNEVFVNERKVQL